MNKKIWASAAFAILWAANCLAGSGVDLTKVNGKWQLMGESNSLLMKVLQRSAGSFQFIVLPGTSTTAVPVEVVQALRDKRMKDHATLVPLSATVYLYLVPFNELGHAPLSQGIIETQNLDAFSAVERKTLN
ncbi:MAG: hypothetical protein U0T84_01370 [Chitinophagales bacterium]